MHGSMGGMSPGASWDLATPGGAITSIGRLASALNPFSPGNLFTPPSRTSGSHHFEEGDTVQLLTGPRHETNSAVIGTVIIVKVGEGARFHFRVVGPQFAVVAGLTITNDVAARQQMAWMDDDDVVQEGITPVSEMTKAIFAVPVACLQSLSRAHRSLQL